MRNGTPPVQHEALQSPPPEPTGKTSLKSQVTSLQNMLDCAQQLNEGPDKQTLVATLTTQLEQENAKLMDQLPLTERLKLATAEHTRAQSAVTHYNALEETLKAQLHQAQQQSQAAQRKLAQAKTQLDLINSKAAQQAAAATSLPAPSMDIPSIIGKALTGATVAQGDLMHVYAWLQGLVCPPGSGQGSPLVLPVPNGPTSIPPQVSPQTSSSVSPPTQVPMSCTMPHLVQNPAPPAGLVAAQAFP